MALPAVDVWQATEFHLIGFPLTPQVGVEQNWWNDLTGGDAVSTRSRVERVDKGPCRGRELTLSIDPLRVIWKADFLPSPDTAAVIIGSYVEVRDWFSALMQQWLAGACPPLKRLSFAAKTVLRTQSRDQAYTQLNDYLPDVNVAPASRDFMYRINRPRESELGIPGLRINRLVTWSAVKIMFQMNMRTIGGPAETVTQQDLEGCLVQLDINTNEDRTDAIPHERLPDVWGELVDLGTEILARGDIA